MNTWLIPAVSLLTTLAAGGLFGVWLTHRRLAPLSRADVTDRDWHRFQGEIARLDAKVKAHEARIEYLEREVESCVDDKNKQAEILNKQAGELVRLRAFFDQQGEFRQMAQNIVSADRTEGEKKP